MSHNQSLAKILMNGRVCWDRAEFRPAARREFDKVLKCRTPALGPQSLRQIRKQKLFVTAVNRELVLVAGIEPPCYGNGNSGPPFPTSPTKVLSLLCQMFSGLSFGGIAICCMIYPRSEPK